MTGVVVNAVLAGHQSSDPDEEDDDVTKSSVGVNPKPGATNAAHRRAL